nr:HVA22-like protein a [Tanacetum cinerariifolium]
MGKPGAAAGDLLLLIAQNLDVLAGPLVSLAYPLNREHSLTLVVLYVYVFGEYIFSRYASIRAIETRNVTDDQQWLTYWVLYSMITLFELTFYSLVECWYQLSRAEVPNEDIFKESEGEESEYPFFEEESMPVCDTDIEDVFEEEEGFVGKGGFGGKEDNIEDVIVVANDLCSSMIQTTLNVDVSLVFSFQDLEHEGSDTRSQGGIILKDKDLEISVVKDQDP